MRYRKIKRSLIHLVNARLAYSEYKRISKDYSLRDIPLALEKRYYEYYQLSNRPEVNTRKEKLKHIRDFIVNIVAIQYQLILVRIGKGGKKL